MRRKTPRYHSYSPKSAHFGLALTVCFNAALRMHLLYLGRTDSEGIPLAKPLTARLHHPRALCKSLAFRLFVIVIHISVSHFFFFVKQICHSFLAFASFFYNKEKNRVTVAQFAPKEAIAITPRSPRFSNRIQQKSTFVKSKIKKGGTAARRCNAPAQRPKIEAASASVLIVSQFPAVVNKKTSICLLLCKTRLVLTRP